MCFEAVCLGAAATGEDVGVGAGGEGKSRLFLTDVALESLR